MKVLTSEVASVEVIDRGRGPLLARVTLKFAGQEDFFVREFQPAGAGLEVASGALEFTAEVTSKLTSFDRNGDREVQAYSRLETTLEKVSVFAEIVRLTVTGEIFASCWWRDEPPAKQDAWLRAKAALNRG